MCKTQPLPKPEMVPTVEEAMEDLLHIYRMLHAAKALYPSHVEKRKSLPFHQRLSPKTWGISSRESWKPNIAELQHRALWRYSEISDLLRANADLQTDIAKAGSLMEEIRAVARYRDRLRELDWCPAALAILEPLEEASIRFAKALRADYLRRVDEGEWPDDENASYVRSFEPQAVGFV